jgi:hypothetical protein
MVLSRPSEFLPASWNATAKFIVEVRVLAAGDLGVRQ